MGLFEEELEKLKKLDQEGDICDIYLNKAVELIESYHKKEIGAEKALFGLLLDMGSFVFGKKILSFEKLSANFDQKTLQGYGIMINEDDIVCNGEKQVWYNSRGKIVGHSLVALFGSSIATAFDSSFVHTYDKSELYGRDCIAYAFNDSKVIMKGYGKVEAYDNSKISASGYSIVISSENATVELKNLAFEHRR